MVTVTGNALLRGTGDGVNSGAINGTLKPNAATVNVVPGDTAKAIGAKGILTVNTLDTSGSGTLYFRLSGPGAAVADSMIITASTPLDLTNLALGVEAQMGSYTLADTVTVLTTTAGDEIIAAFGGAQVGSANVAIQYVNDIGAIVIPSALTPANRVQLAPVGSVTPVTVDAFTAKVEGAGVLLEWNCVSEFQNAGFNVYRRDVQWGRHSCLPGMADTNVCPTFDSGWTRVNPALIAGRITHPDAKTYRLYDWCAAGVYDYKLESIDIAGRAEAYAQFAGPVTLDWNAQTASTAGVDSQTISAVFESSAVEASVRNAERAARSFAALETTGVPASSALLHAAARSIAPGEIAPNSNAQPHGAEYCSVAPASASARWFSAASPSTATSFNANKVIYNNSGVLKIPQSMLSAGFDLRHVSLQREGRSVTALALTPDGLVVFGQGYSDDYTDKDAIFLRSINAPTAAGVAARAQGLFASTQPVNVESPATATADYHDVYFDYNLRPYTFPPWFSSQYLTDGTDQSFAVNTPNASSGSASLTVNLWSLTESETVQPDHALQVLVNGQPAGQAQWAGGGMLMQLTFQIPSGVMLAGANHVELVTPEIAGVASQISFLHSMTFSYTQSLNASQPLTITNAGTASNLYELSNLPGSDAWVVDARFPDRAALVPYESQAQADGTYRLRFMAAGGGTGQFQIVPAGQENLPVSVSKRQVKPLKLAGQYMATGPSQFSAGVQPLLAQRAKEGVRGSFVDQEQLFDYYNYGRYGPAGIQNAVQAARPQYLLLLGRTTSDYKNYSGLNVDPLCPTFLVSTTFWAQTTSDSTFGDLGRGYPEVAVGRLPVNNPSQLSVAVQHILSNAGAPGSGVRVQAVADQTDPAVADFPAQAAAMGQALPDLAWQPNYLGVTYQTSAEVNAAMTDAANGGADWIVYVGHGNASRLGRLAPRILDTDTVQAWTGNVVFLQSTCTANWAAGDTTVFNSIAVQALTQPQGGISASIASSTYMNSDCAVEFMGQLMKTANTAGMRWGNALMKAQQWASAKDAGGPTASFYSDLNKTEQLFGDPAMPVLQKNSGTAPASGNSSNGAKTTPVAPGQF